ncbi:hypothetical protein FACS1894162_8750 [Bacteroidia bacterium]|nr:hypothetical protein FACS1894162_8750 [Bacteroidia bacterium]
MNTLINYFVENWKGGIWLIAGGAIIYFYFMIKSKVDLSNKSIKTLPCESHSNNIDIQRENYRNLDLKMAKLAVSVEYSNKTLSAISDKMGINIIQPLMQKQSPISLTQRGREVADDLGMEQQVIKNWETISYLIKSDSDSRNPYDIQKFITENNDFNTSSRPIF